MWRDACIGMCVEIHMTAQRRTGVCVDVRSDMHTVMCIHICTHTSFDLRVEVPYRPDRFYSRHVYGHAYLPAASVPCLVGLRCARRTRFDEAGAPSSANELPVGADAAARQPIGPPARPVGSLGCVGGQCK